MKQDNENMSDNQDCDDLAATYEELDFSCDYSKNLPEILKTLNISLAVTSYQASRLILIRSDGNQLDINFKNFHRPMGLAATDSGLTLGVFNHVVNFQREDGLLDKIKQPLEKIEDDVTAPKIKAPDNKLDPIEERLKEHKELSSEELEQQEKDKEDWENYQKKLYEPVDERVDACFISRSIHYSGMINIHDIDWGNDGLWAVNSSFSCLCTLEPDYSFVPRWKPSFISELVPEDRCHLNGMTLKDGVPAYVTTFSKFDDPQAWRKDDHFDGTLIDVKSNKVLIDNLVMPHSPRWHDKYVYYCNSGNGEVCRYDPNIKQSQIIAELQGFTRGMDFYGPLIFVGLSKVRASDVTRPAPLSKKYSQTFSGIWLLNLQDFQTSNPTLTEPAGHIKFTGNIDQIYDVAVIPNCNFPELIEPTHPRMRNHFCHPELQHMD